MNAMLDIWVYPTRSCNFCCSYCYEDHDLGFMTEDVAEQTVEWAFSQALLANAKGVSFYFFGGEPLLAFTVVCHLVMYAQEAARACRLQTQFRMNTNGSLINDEVAAFLLANRIALDLSLDGDKSTNDAFRKTKTGFSAYDAIGGVTKVRCLLDYGIPISVNMVVGPQTVRHLSRNVRFFWTHGITGINALPMFDGEGEWTESDLHDLNTQLNDIAGAIVIGVLERGEMGLLDFNPFAKVIRLIRAGDKPDSATQYREHTYCGMGRRNFAIDRNGNIYPCTRFIHEKRIDRTNPSLIVGNVSRRGYNRSVIDQFRAWNPRLNPLSACSGCIYALTCIYQCIAENLAWNGDEYAVLPIVCKIMPIVYQHALEIRKILFPKQTQDQLPLSAS